MYSETPFVSIVMAVLNESKMINMVLESLVTQNYPFDKYEILIADGLSEDNTRKIIQAYQSKNPNIHLFDNQKRIVSTGLNILISKAKGDLIIRTDGHTILDSDYIYSCVKESIRTKADNVGGLMNAIGVKYFEKAVALALNSPFGVGGSKFHFSEKEDWVDTVYMGAWPKSVFTRYGLFDEELVRDQDDEFNYRLRSKGGKIFLSQIIKSSYYVRSSIPSLWRQFYGYGLYKVRVFQKHPRQMSLRQFIPPLFVLSIGLAFLLTLIFPWGWFFLVELLIVYLLANFFASYLTAQGKIFKVFYLLPPTFATMHISYGLGFLVGMFKFWNRWGDKIGKVPPFQPGVY